MNEVISELFHNAFGAVPSRVDPLLAHASSRRMLRIAGGGYSAIAVMNDDASENRAFIEFAKHFRSYGLSVPQIYGVRLDSGIYLVEDLGDTTLLDVLQADRVNLNTFPATALKLYQDALSYLVEFQVVAGPTVPYEFAHQGEVYDIRAMLKDMHYFRNTYLWFAGIKVDLKLLENDFEKLASFLTSGSSTFFMYRDFQSRNIMVRDGKLFFIDFQSGRMGPLQYDVASLLFQSTARVPAEIREELLQHYLNKLSLKIPVDEARFISFYWGYVVLRILQVLATYAKQGISGGKEYFAKSIPPALSNLRSILDAGVLKSYPILEGALFQATEKSSGESNG